jgi:CRP-like cAMP-binding protein
VHDVLLNLGYGLNLIALSVRDVLLLRIVLLPAQVSFLAWGLVAGIRATVAWNIVFISINLFQVLRILRERRPITLPADIADIYKESFSGLRPREFWLFWETGRERTVCDEPFVRQGEKPNDLIFIVSGAAKVVRNGSAVAVLNAGQFAAEMSFLSGNPATADVVADGAVALKAWNQNQLSLLENVNPALLLKLQRVLSQDLAAKAQATSIDARA